MASLQRYSDRRVLITGGGSGIGQATVLRILDEGGLVVAADISESGLKDTVAKAEAHGDRLTTVVMDVGAEQSVQNGVADAVKALGGLDTLVNVAGILRSAHFARHHPCRLRAGAEDQPCRHLPGDQGSHPRLAHGKDPAVVNFSSTSAAFAHPYMAAYAASKGGVQAMTHALALEFAKEKIRFNSVQPGSISVRNDRRHRRNPSRASDPDCPPMRTTRCSARSPPVLPLDGGAIFAKPDAVAAVVAMLGSTRRLFHRRNRGPCRRRHPHVDSAHEHR